MAFVIQFVPATLTGPIPTSPNAVPADTTASCPLGGGAPLQHTYEVTRAWFRKTDAGGTGSSTLLIRQTTPAAVTSNVTLALSIATLARGNDANFVIAASEVVGTPMTLAVGNTVDVFVADTTQENRGIVYLECIRKTTIGG